MYIPLTFEGALQKCLFATAPANEGFFLSGSQQWKYHWFTGSAALEVQKGTIDNVQIFVIGGGGGGGRGIENVTAAGGGGGGGVAFTYNARLFQGTYNISVGKGGDGALSQQNNGNDGFSSSIAGPNLNISIGGGGGGQWAQGVGTTRGGTSGNGFLGGTNIPLDGGGGGGASSTGSNGTSTRAGDGGTGISFNIANYVNQFGCGGGGYAADSSDPNGVTCNIPFGGGGDIGTDGANKFGMGGGGGGARGGDGGSGSVIIQYPIFDYCSNYFNETGSCGCRQITFDITNQLNFRPNITGSFIYYPCGGTQFVSGSLSAYNPLTVCAVSNSYYSYSEFLSSTNELNVYSGFVNQQYLPNAPQCTSASLVPQPCSLGTFTATCTSSIISFYTPSASVSRENKIFYVEKNATTTSSFTSTSPSVKYICVSSGSEYGTAIKPYPQVTSGSFIQLYQTASCNTITVTLGGGRRSRIVNCGGIEQILISPSNGSTYCIDSSIGVRDIPGFSPVLFTVGGDCLSGSFDTSSCGCP